MLQVMARQPKTASKGSRDGKQDFFVRVDDDLAKKFDAIVEAMVPRASRSAVIAMLIQRYVEERSKADRGGGK